MREDRDGERESLYVYMCASLCVNQLTNTERNKMPLMIWCDRFLEQKAEKKKEK